MKKSTRLVLILAIVMIAAVLSSALTAFAQDKVELKNVAKSYDFLEQSSKDDFTYRNITVDSVKDGILNLTLAGRNGGTDDAAMFVKNFSVDAEKCNAAIVRMKSNLVVEKNNSTSLISIYFKTDTIKSYSEKLKNSAVITCKTDDYVEYLIDFSKNEAWTGTITAFFFSLHQDAVGTANIDYINFGYIPEPEKMLKPEDKLTDFPNSERYIVTDKFSNVNEYKDNFTDVPFGQWYYSSVAGAYELGLVNGKSENKFDPTGTMTVAEAVTLASRMHSTYCDDGEAAKIAAMSSGKMWYSNYVDYAKKCGFLKDGQFDSYDRNIRRWEMVSLFSAALPDDCFDKLNDVTAIPDVPKTAPYFNDLIKFYNAGIAMGSDIYGTFKPDSNIVRSEVAAIVNRIAIHRNRLDCDLAVRNDSRGAYYLVDDSSYTGRNSVTQSLVSGWNFDNRGGVAKQEDEPPYALCDISDTDGTALIRQLNVQTSGVVTLSTSFRFSLGANGLYVQFTSSDNKLVYKLSTHDDAFYVLSDGKEIKLAAKPQNGSSYSLKVVIDLNNRKIETVINNVSQGTHNFASGANDINCYKIGTTEKDKLTVSPGLTKIYCNYLVNEEVNVTAEKIYDWNVSNSGDMTSAAKNGEFVFGGNKGTASINHTFEKTKGQVAADLIFLYPKTADGLLVSLNSGSTAVVTFAAKNGKLYANDRELREYSENMWYMLRIVADTNTQKATVKVSGKTVATDIPFAAAADGLDGLTISQKDLGGNTLRVDEIKVQRLPDYDDYVPEPVVPEGKDDYYVGVNWCSLWRNGYHWGWDNISPYDENKPVLGWYDEGLPETEDWEIKYMAEHGIDFELICWYHSGERPLKTFYGSTPEALFDGFMNARYSEKYGKFALLWEAANGAKPSNSADFRNNFVPFWKEYFFSDKRYMTIDNKLVISVFGASSLTSCFGSDAGVKAEFDYVRQVAVDMGFDGVIFMACSGNTDEASLAKLKSMGFDAVHAYNWGGSGASASATQSLISKQSDTRAIHNVPTVSTGFNNLAWAYTRSANISVDNYKQVLTWVRDKALPFFANEDEAWKSKFVMLSTWNEYGEGTYICPSGLNGFGYLDTVRDVFTKGGAHTDVKPDNKQLERINHLYPINRELIRPQGYYTTPEYNELIGTMNFDDKWAFAEGTATAVDNGMLFNVTGNDPRIQHKAELNIDATTVKSIKVYVDAPVGESVSLYFTTKDDKTWSQSKCRSAEITEAGMNPVTINIGVNTMWTGTVTGLRVDPVNRMVNCTVQKIELYGLTKNTVYRINNKIVDFNIEPVSTKTDTLIPFFPDDGIAYQLGVYYTWDKIHKVLTIMGNGHEIVFTMSSNIAKIDGTYVRLSDTPYLEDGIPMLPYHWLIEKLGYSFKVTEDGNTTYYDLMTISEEYVETMNSRVDDQWEFNIPGDMESWTVGNGYSYVGDDGCLYTSSIGSGKSDGTFDVALTSPVLNFDASKYSKLVVKMKHDIKTPLNEDNIKKFTLGIYFKANGGGLAEARRINLPLEQSSNDEYVTYTFDMSSHEQWKGRVSGIRVDPSDAEGEFWIDYIRFEK